MNANRLLQSLAALAAEIDSAEGRKALAALEAQAKVIRDRTQGGKVALDSSEAAELSIDFASKSMELAVALIEGANRKAQRATETVLRLERRLAEADQKIVKELEKSPAGRYVADLLRRS